MSWPRPDEPEQAAADGGSGGWVRALQGLTVLTLASFVASVVLRREPGYVLLYDAVLGNLALALPAVLCLLRAWRVRADRLASLLLATGICSFVAGNLIYNFHVQFLDATPFPSWADVGYLATYPCFLAALVLLLRAEVGGLPRAVSLDGLVGVLGAAAAGSLLLAPVLDAATGSTAALLVGAAYPLGDLLLLAMVVGVLVVQGGRPGRRWLGVGAGLAIYAVADTWYLIRLATDSYVVGTPWDALWAVGLGVLAMGCWTRPAAQQGNRPDGAAALALPALFTLIAVGVLAVGSELSVPRYTVVLATLTLLAVLVRTAVAFRDVRVLAATRQQARTDDLTGLPNRRWFLEHLTSGLAQRPAESPAAVLLLDLDRFKEINDTLGHHVGDELLRLIGPRLSARLRPGDALARLGGDEFALLLVDTDQDSAQEVARRLAIGLAEPFTLDGVTLHIGGSVGLALCPQHATDAAGLLQRADVAMYEAKAGRHDHVVYDPQRDQHSRARLRTVEELRAALEADQLVVHYQPKWDVARRTVVGVEALVRWQHPQRGLLFPGAFLPLVEQTGLMPALTLAVLRRAVRQCRHWRLDGLHLTVAVNLSASNLLDDRLPDQVALILSEAELPASALTLEITEDTLMVDPDRAVVTLTALRRLGVMLSVDDYGTGYCSLAYLRDLPVDELKLDRSFVRELTAHGRPAAIVRSTVELAHALGMTMVAEGVEDAAALDLLHRFGCDQAQGYYLARPQDPSTIEPWLRQNTARTAPSADAPADPARAALAAN